MRRGWLWVLVPLLGTATQAEATTNDFQALCSTGALRTCASVQLSTLALSGGGTQVWLRVRNLQGTLDVDNTRGSLITRLGLTHPSLEGVSGLSVATEGGAEAILSEKKQAADPASLWQITSEGDGGGIGGQVTFATGVGGTDGGILGCDPADANPKSYFQTCGSPTTEGDEGWVVFSFTTTNSWDAADGQVAWKVQAVTADGGSYTCRSGSADCVVTPEPVTMTLLGSGLLGLGYIRRRRGARGEEEEAAV